MQKAGIESGIGMDLIKEKNKLREELIKAVKQIGCKGCLKLRIFTNKAMYYRIINKKSKNPTSKLLFKVKENPIQNKWFDRKHGGALDMLMDDIKMNGIETSLKAMPNNMLLCGHNRLLCAEILGMETVPVRYSKKNLTEKEQERAIVSDNASRRHNAMSHSKKCDFYGVLFPGFKERLLVNTKVNPKSGISAKKLSKKTGLSISKSEEELTKLRHTEKKIVAKKQRQINTGIDEAKIVGIKSSYTALRKNMRNYNQETNTAILKRLAIEVRETKKIFSG